MRKEHRTTTKSKTITDNNNISVFHTSGGLHHTEINKTVPKEITDAVELHCAFQTPMHSHRVKNCTVRVHCGKSSILLEGQPRVSTAIPTTSLIPVLKNTPRTLGLPPPIDKTLSWRASDFGHMETYTFQNTEVSYAREP